MSDTSRPLSSLLSCADDDQVDDAVHLVFQDLVDDIVRGVAFDVHRSVKSGLFAVLHPNSSGESSSTRVEQPLKDVFGQDITTEVGVPTLKKQPECICPNCKRNLAASRFAPHLEKCMGMGRNSSRLASRRLATNSKDPCYRESGAGDGGEDDDAEDEDWIEPGTRGGQILVSSGAQSSSNNRRNRGRDKNSPRRSKARKGGNSDTYGGSDGTITPPTNYDQLSLEERSQWLSTICGVVSHTSRKICSRSMRCPVHTDAQRREVRVRWLSSHHGHDQDDAHMDIDSFSEGDTAALRESLSQLSNASSPAESTISTGSHTSSVRGSSSRSNRGGDGSKRSRSKKSRPGSKSVSRGSTPPLLPME